MFCITDLKKNIKNISFCSFSLFSSNKVLGMENNINNINNNNNINISGMKNNLINNNNNNINNRIMTKYPGDDNMPISLEDYIEKYNETADEKDQIFEVGYLDTYNIYDIYHTQRILKIAKRNIKYELIIKILNKRNKISNMLKIQSNEKDTRLLGRKKERDEENKVYKKNNFEINISTDFIEKGIKDDLKDEKSKTIFNEFFNLCINSDLKKNTEIIKILNRIHNKTENYCIGLIKKKIRLQYYTYVIKKLKNVISTVKVITPEILSKFEFSLKNPDRNMKSVNFNILFELIIFDFIYNNVEITYDKKTINFLNFLKYYGNDNIISFIKQPNLYFYKRIFLDKSRLIELFNTLNEIEKTKYKHEDSFKNLGRNAIIIATQMYYLRFEKNNILSTRHFVENVILKEIEKMISNKNLNVKKFENIDLNFISNKNNNKSAFTTFIFNNNNNNKSAFPTSSNINNCKFYSKGFINVGGVIYRKVIIPGDGNCLLYCMTNFFNNDKFECEYQGNFVIAADKLIEAANNLRSILKDYLDLLIFMDINLRMGSDDLAILQTELLKNKVFLSTDTLRIISNYYNTEILLRIQQKEINSGKVYIEYKKFTQYCDEFKITEYEFNNSNSLKISYSVSLNGNIQCPDGHYEILEKQN